MKKGNRQSPEAYIQGMVELIGALSNIRNGNGGVALTDPSINVKELSELRSQYEREIRTLNDEWQKRFDGERQRANDAKADKESTRVDARFSELSTQALTLVNTVATTAKAASDAVAAAALTQTEAMNQLRDIVSSLGTTVTALVAAGGSEKSSRSSTQQRDLAVMGFVVAVAVVIGNFILSKL